MASRKREVLSPAAYEKAVADTMSVNTPMSPQQISRGIDLGAALVEKNRRRRVSAGRTAFQLWEAYRTRAAREERRFLVGGDRRRARRDNGTDSLARDYALAVHSILRNRYGLSRAEADGAIARWSQLLRSSWAANRHTGVVAREIKRYEEGE
jgi:hypothetical protein